MLIKRRYNETCRLSERYLKLDLQQLLIAAVAAISIQLGSQFSSNSIPFNAPNVTACWCDEIDAMLAVRERGRVMRRGLFGALLEPPHTRRGAQ